MRHGPDSKLARAVASAWGNSVSVPIDQCRECFAIWEPWPDDDPGPELRDIVECDPCPNCAYRAGSPESKDPKEWARLKALAVKAADRGLVAGPKEWFCCHRGIPIKVDEDGIRFDFEAADVDPLHQSCVGFMRIYWKHNGAEARKQGAQ